MDILRGEDYKLIGVLCLTLFIKYKLLYTQTAYSNMQ